MKLLRFQSVIFTFLLSSLGCFSQQEINIGEGKKLVSVFESNDELVFGIQDVEIGKDGEASFFILMGNTKLGPFDKVEERVVVNASGTEKSSKSYFIANEGQDRFIVTDGQKFGPYFSPELLKVCDRGVAIVDYAMEGTFYEIFNSKGKSITKSELYQDVLIAIHVSDEMDVLLGMDARDGEASHYFIYEGKKTEGFYHAVHFQGWIKTRKEGLQPVFYCVAPIDHEMYQVTNDVYIGNRLIDKIVAVLYDFSFNRNSTDFIFKGYTAVRDGARVYTLENSLGPYQSISNLTYDSSDNITFEFEEDDKPFIYDNGSIKKAKSSKDYDWKNVTPYGADFVKSVSREDGQQDIYFNDRVILTGEEWNVDFITWTRKHGPVLLERLMKTEGFGEVPNGFRLSINGESTETYQSIIDFKESPNGEIAYIAYNKDGFYVFRGEQTYGPYMTFYSIGKERENFLKWSPDGKDVYYSAILDRESHIFKNGVSLQSYPNVVSSYWNESTSTLVVVKINDNACLLESDFLTNPLDREPFNVDMDGAFEQELSERREYLSSAKNCNSILFNGKEYEGLRFVNNLKISTDGTHVSFKDLDDPMLISNNELLNGTMLNDKLIFYKDGIIHISQIKGEK
jgi:hypothetical protein